ncbi:hypothetical protein HYPSUDRAFT_44395 [Hypholoma sublateritium FD-334 SS-4]|uniref:Uncharacterized protein n=1 Tax=Hypholoma sublateritium (strain FD-334 SS-4) TaxID=945553 RepID=A0A0D2M7W0_HYPSF|nr:hypothetical protein HYPSUDRAFT_44395 [Hypholoma sublateritium FD-334 SS-4]
MPIFHTAHPRAQCHGDVSPGTLGCSRGALTAHLASLTRIAHAHPAHPRTSSGKSQIEIFAS